MSWLRWLCRLGLHWPRTTGVTGGAAPPGSTVYADQVCRFCGQHRWKKVRS